MNERLGLRNLPSDRELREWAVSRRVAVAYLVLPIAGAVVVALTRFWNPLFRLLTAEDRIFEWAQFACWVVAALASGTMALRLFRGRRHAVALLWAALALGLFLVAGEEIAWGQRLFGLETPTVLERVNRQGEITVHNIQGVRILFAAVFVIAGLYGAGSAIWLRYLRPPTRRDLVDLLVPPLFLASLFILVPLYKLIRALLDVAGVPSLLDYGEYIELCLAFGFASFGVLSLRRRGLGSHGSLDGPRMRSHHDEGSRSQAGSSL